MENMSAFFTIYGKPSLSFVYAISNFAEKNFNDQLLRPRLLMNEDITSDQSSNITA